MTAKTGKSRDNFNIKQVNLMINAFQFHQKQIPIHNFHKKCKWCNGSNLMSKQVTLGMFLKNNR